MKANSSFENRSSSFWAYAKLISEKIGYSKGGQLRTYSSKQVLKKLEELEIAYNLNELVEVLDYLNYRTYALEKLAKNTLMTVEEARKEFKQLHLIHKQEGYLCSLPLNKQKNEKKDFAYFTGIINILTERTLRRYANKNGLIYGTDLIFDDNPMRLTYFTSDTNKLEGIMSRRFDGALPSTVNPVAIWEIKEYYYTTTFGSRIADGVYETQLDGFEINTISRETSRDVKHIYFIDDYNTWWNMGKSYLCRIVDMLHMGLVDEVIFGNEVFDRWPILLERLLENEDIQIKLDLF